MNARSKVAPQPFGLWSSVIRYFTRSRQIAKFARVASQVAIILSLGVTSIRADAVDAVQLPEFSDVGAVRLGSIPATEQAGCRFEIVNAKSNGARYVVEKSTDGNSWKVQRSTRPDPKPVGTLRFQGDYLQFNWQPEITRALAAGLRNSRSP